ncbi:hypothetical protein EW026_g74 [Hermanssonia centrifuga]|uniref:Porin n=1 Tax=Hermanssonia centrifuga TaxID=98765 RepID=A0A4S4KVU0_9APHY|nr:hypothetical protein EW026_g74 [Hermanssonia centrifuga]
MKGIFSFLASSAAIQAGAAGHVADIKYGQLSDQNGAADSLQVITGGVEQHLVGHVGERKHGTTVSLAAFGSPQVAKVFTGSLNGQSGTDWHVGALGLPIGDAVPQITETDFY